MRVTDHAVLRFAQYALELDVSAIQTQLTSMVGKPDGDYPIGVKNLRARVKDGVVVTVVKPSRAYRKKRAKVKTLSPLLESEDCDHDMRPCAYGGMRCTKCYLGYFF